MTPVGPRWLGAILPRHRFSAMLLVVGSIVLGVGLIEVHELRTTNQHARIMYESSIGSLDTLNQLQYLTEETHRNVLYTLTTDRGTLQGEYATQSRATDKDVTAVVEQYIQ